MAVAASAAGGVAHSDSTATVSSAAAALLGRCSNMERRRCTQGTCTSCRPRSFRTERNGTGTGSKYGPTTASTVVCVCVCVWYLKAPVPRRTRRQCASNRRCATGDGRANERSGTKYARRRPERPVRSTRIARARTHTCYTHRNMCAIN